MAAIARITTIDAVFTVRPNSRIASGSAISASAATSSGWYFR